jgi:hypothetical protein
MLIMYFEKKQDTWDAFLQQAILISFSGHEGSHHNFTGRIHSPIPSAVQLLLGVVGLLLCQIPLNLEFLKLICGQMNDTPS